MKPLARLLTVGLSMLVCYGCGEIKPEVSATTKKDSPTHGSKGHKVQLILGQDLNSIRGYVKSAKYPSLVGVTTYLSFYNLLNPAFPAYGALGKDLRGYATNEAIDWGAGPLNALALAQEYPKAVLNIGLNIAEGNQSVMWAEGGLAAIARGKHDNEIRRLATFFKSIRNPVYLRIGYEFDGVWNKGYENTRNYIAAYRRIVDVLRSQKVTRVQYVWQASASPVDDIIEGKHEDIRRWYPGDRYVDWVGLSWFLAPDKAVKGARSQRQLADEVLAFARAKNKPVIIAESAPQGYDLNQLTTANISPVWDGKAGENRKEVTAEKIWQSWFSPFFAYIRENKQAIKAVSYINADWESQALWSSPYSNGYWGDSRVQSNPEISRRWLAEINDSSVWEQR